MHCGKVASKRVANWEWQTATKVEVASLCQVCIKYCFAFWAQLCWCHVCVVYVMPNQDRASSSWCIALREWVAVDKAENGWADSGWHEESPVQMQMQVVCQDWERLSCWTPSLSLQLWLQVWRIWNAHIKETSWMDFREYVLMAWEDLQIYSIWISAWEWDLRRWASFKSLALLWCIPMIEYLWVNVPCVYTCSYHHHLYLLKPALKRRHETWAGVPSWAACPICAIVTTCILVCNVCFLSFGSRFMLDITAGQLTIAVVFALLMPKKHPTWSLPQSWGRFWDFISTNKMWVQAYVTIQDCDKTIKSEITDLSTTISIRTISFEEGYLLSLQQILLPWCFDTCHNNNTAAIQESICLARGLRNLKMLRTLKMTIPKNGTEVPNLLTCESQGFLGGIMPAFKHCTRLRTLELVACELTVHLRRCVLHEYFLRLLNRVWYPCMQCTIMAIFCLTPSVLLMCFPLCFHH